MGATLHEPPRGCMGTTFPLGAMGTIGTMWCSCFGGWVQVSVGGTLSSVGLHLGVGGEANNRAKPPLLGRIHSREARLGGSSHIIRGPLSRAIPLEP